MLGPNCAGKTTTIGIFTTRVRVTGGQVFVAGAYVLTAALVVRRRSGLVPSRLKAQAPGDTLVEVTFDGDAAPAVDAARALDGVSNAEGRGPLLRVFSRRGGQIIPAIIDAGEAVGLSVRDIHLSRPSLETL